MKNKKVNQIRQRALILLVFVFFAGFLLTIVQLYKIQVRDGHKYSSKVSAQSEGSVMYLPTRGSIYDRNGKVLAQSSVVWDVCISPAEITEDQWTILASGLSTILGIEENDILKYKEKTSSYYERIKQGVDSNVREEIIQFLSDHSDLKIKGVFTRETYKRYYTYDNLASNLIGFTGHDHQGAYGLEAYYNSVLAGTPGKNISANDIRSDASNQSFDAKNGYSVMLTIDEAVQATLERNLEMANTEHGVKNRSTAIFMNIHTGEILGMATKPDFNPNDPYTFVDPNLIKALEESGFTQGTEEYTEEKQGLLYDQWRNKAVSDPYEPGSVYKIVTASMALEEERANFGESYYCSGSIKVAEDTTMNCWWPAGHGHQDLYGIMRNSCNPAFIEVGYKNGVETTLKYQDDFGFGKMTGIDLPGEAIGMLHANMSKVNLASSSIGQSITVTPIQMITAASAAVNGGKLVQPYVVRQIMDSDGNVIETTQPLVKRQVISDETSMEIRKLVEEVVSNGSGKNAAVPGYRVGGKTGTSEKLNLKILNIDEYVLSFIGFAPMDNPTYACLVVLDEPTLSNAYASVIAAPVVGAIFAETLPYLGVEAYYSEGELASKAISVPYLIGKKPHDAQADLTALGLKTRMIGQGGQVVRQIPVGKEDVAKSSTVVLYTSEEDLKTNIIVPDLSGLSPEQARAKLYELGLNVQFIRDSSKVGSTVTEQWPLVDAVATTADVVKLTLKISAQSSESGLSEQPLTSIPAETNPQLDDDTPDVSTPPSTTVPDQSELPAPTTTLPEAKAATVTDSSTHSTASDSDVKVYTPADTVKAIDDEITDPVDPVDPLEDKSKFGDTGELLDS